MSIKTIKLTFLAGGIYDLVLGIVFGFCFKCIYGYCEIPLPNHDAFIQFPAALVAIFGIGFLMVSRDPQGNRAIVPLGILLKISYVGIVGGHWLLDTMPSIFVPFVFIDLVFLALFAAAWQTLKKA